MDMDFYLYWEEFIDTWNSIQCNQPSGKELSEDGYRGWTNPDSLLYNNSKTRDLASSYIPEPWWGNDGSQHLHSVVVNFNPGVGGEEQRHGVIPYQTSYSKEIVLNGNILPLTAAWHWKYRGKPILEALKRNGYITSYQGLQNHLSIELIPWHTYGVDRNYWKYLEQNTKEVFEHAILFAAHESHRIVNDKLRDVVILRTGEKATERLIKCLATIGIHCVMASPEKSYVGDAGKSIEFKIQEVPDVRFVSVWGTHSRNHFPVAILDNIIKFI